MAFCAGTGALVFLDLVAQLLIKNCFDSETQKGGPLDDLNFYRHDFSFHLYASFADRDTAIGLDLIEACEKVKEKLGRVNFKATVRLSKTDEGAPKLPRWTPAYIQEELTPLAGKMKRVWVCGPPAVNELFDRTLNDLKDKL